MAQWTQRRCRCALSDCVAVECPSVPSTGSSSDVQKPGQHAASVMLWSEDQQRLVFTLQVCAETRLSWRRIGRQVAVTCHRLVQSLHVYHWRHAITSALTVRRCQRKLSRWVFSGFQTVSRKANASAVWKCFDEFCSTFCPRRHRVITCCCCSLIV